MNRVEVTPNVAEVLQGPHGDLAVAVTSLGVALGSIGTSIFQEALRDRVSGQKDLHCFANLCQGASRPLLSDAQTLLETLSQVGNFLHGQYESALKQAQVESIEDMLLNMPLVLPGNKMVMESLPRGSMTVILEAPEDAPDQLKNNFPDGENLAMPQFPSKGILKSFFQDEAKATDLLVIKNADRWIVADVNDPGAPEVSRVSEVFRRLSRGIQENPHLSVVAFFTELDSRSLAHLKDNNCRIIRWSPEFGPEAFYGKEDAQSRYDQLKSEAETQFEQLQNSQDGETDSDSDSDSEEGPSSEIIVT